AVADRRKSRSRGKPVQVISYQPAGCRRRGRGMAFEWLLPEVLRFVEAGIELKQNGQPPPNDAYIVGYDRVRLRTLEMVRRWLLKAQRSNESLIEVPSRGTPEEQYDLGGYLTVAAWFGRFIHDWRHRSLYCPQCKKSYAKGNVKFVILGPCPSGQPRPRVVRRERAPTGYACPKGHLLIRD